MGGAAVVGAVQVGALRVGAFGAVPSEVLLCVRVAREVPPRRVDHSVDRGVVCSLCRHPFCAAPPPPLL